MSRRLPLVATLVVAAAVATMIALGVWQLGRADEKAALLARYGQAQNLPGEVAFPSDGDDAIENALYRRSSLTCVEVRGTDSVAGRSVTGETGWAHVAHCGLPGGGEAAVALGWSREPHPPAWEGGAVNGFVAPAGDSVRLVASPAEAGLAQLARPDPNDLPNNHLAYAVQWFFFAATAVVIYILALRRRQRG